MNSTRPDPAVMLSMQPFRTKRSHDLGLGNHRIVSAISRRRREGMLPALSCVRPHRKILADTEGGLYVKNGLAAEAHREAECLSLPVGDVALRAAAIVTHDLRLAEAAAEPAVRS